MIEKLYKANLIAAVAYGLVSLFLCATYELWLPHPVGHIYPALAAGVTGIWSFHCWQLGRVAGGKGGKVALRYSFVPLLVSLVAAVVCFTRYLAQRAA